MIDAHHHLWDLSAVNYPWLEATGVPRFFGDPTPIQRDYLVDEFIRDASAQGFTGSVHIQVGAADGLAEAKWVQHIAEQNPVWPMVQVVFCDLTSPDLPAQLDAFEALSTVRGVRQIIGRAPGEDKATGTNDLLQSPAFLAGLTEVGRRGLSFDLQLIPELMTATANILEAAPDTRVALCHAGSPHDRSSRGLDRWAQNLRHLSTLPQVVCKLSGLGMFDHRWTNQKIAPLINTCLDQFGPERCMFGSNFPVDSLYSNYATLVAAHCKIVPETSHTAVFGRTAKSFYNL